MVIDIPVEDEAFDVDCLQISMRRLYQRGDIPSPASTRDVALESLRSVTPRSQNYDNPEVDDDSEDECTLG